MEYGYTRTGPNQIALTWDRGSVTGAEVVFGVRTGDLAEAEEAAPATPPLESLASFPVVSLRDGLPGTLQGDVKGEGESRGLVLLLPTGNASGQQKEALTEHCNHFTLGRFRHTGR
jgi:hypothetical protein